MKSKKIRVNITVDRELLEKARTKLHFFGGKLSTLFNAYLEDFVVSMDSSNGESRKEIFQKIEMIEKRILKIEETLKKKNL